MTERTYLDEIVRYPDMVLMELSKNQTFVSLLLNKKDADLDDEETAELWNSRTNNFIKMTEPVIETQSFCWVDTRLQVDGDEVIDAYIDVLIGVHDDNMSLKNSVFTGLSGNRRDNLVREADYSLHNHNDFGIGKLRRFGFIESVRTTNSPLFTSKILHYKVSTFGNPRNITRG